MSLNEFDLISRYFKNKSTIKKNDVVLGIGDDCALLDIPEGQQLAVTTDSLVCGVHFFADVDPYRLGYKSLAVNLSDLAAMGAQPKWVSLAITLPDTNNAWLAEFSRGFFELANKFNVSLVGGDTTRGPLSITVCAKGIVPRGFALQRDHAMIDDLICISGNLGDGAVGLACKLKEILMNNPDYFIDTLEVTEPRIKLGVLLRGLASSCIDISDGLTQDLQHILNASHCSARIELEKIPLSSALCKEVARGSLSAKNALQYALTGGDDYELLFTITSENLRKLKLRMQKTDTAVPDITVIGSLNLSQSPSIQLFENQQPVSFSQQGWDHFQQGNN